jgi:hypothetical protein
MYSIWPRGMPISSNSRSVSWDNSHTVLLDAVDPEGNQDSTDAVLGTAAPSLNEA